MRSLLLKSFALILSLFWIGCFPSKKSDFPVESISSPIVKLNGTWLINNKSGIEPWKENNINEDWKEIQVPGEAMMQGFLIKHDIPFFYKKEIDIPIDYAGKNLLLQFDGVYSYARVWVNGNFVKDHYGGFTRWKCDITRHVKAGEKAWITVEVTDRADDISYASGYAKHPIGGILRDVKLLVLPENYPEKIRIETNLDAEYINADLIISGSLENKAHNAKIEIQLLDENKQAIKLVHGTVVLDGENEFQFRNTISNPQKWDAEHPHLYSIRISFYENAELLWSEDKSFGFREVKVAGNQFLVNGKPVKLRGACRHDVHPTLGRVSTPEYELKDVLLAKESNMNYLRTSHYPPTDNFLKLCDQYGIYVEDETAICFVINYRIPGYEEASKSQSDPAYTERYLSQLKEMVDLHRNHPSVVIWSIGNESIYGSNFQKSFDWLEENDSTRPVMFSYPGSTPDSLPQPYQILSMHYPPFTGDLDQYGLKTKAFGYEEMPVIYDEWAHVACYNNATIIEDPNIRDFWGQSLDSMWIKTFESDGGLGGAIWGMIDETFMLPENLEGYGTLWGKSGKDDSSILGYKGHTVGYGEWGVVDVWRRKKPEFWNTKKAYSPIRILKKEWDSYQSGSLLSIPVYNRFDHTNLNDIKITYTYAGQTKTLANVNLPPHQKGEFGLPIKEWDNQEPIEIAFYDRNNMLIDVYLLSQKNVVVDAPISKTGEVRITEQGSKFTVHTKVWDFVVEKESGLVTTLVQNGNRLKFSGPHMVYKTKGNQLTYSSNSINTYGGAWKLELLEHELVDNKAVLKIQGMDDNINIEYEMHIYANGTWTNKYAYHGLSKENVREIGIKYITEDSFDELAWKRKPYWSTYSENHLSSRTGKTTLYTDNFKTYREKPLKSWEMDTKSFYYDGTTKEQPGELVNVAKATKDAVLEYALLKNGNKRISVMGQGDVSCRLAKLGDNLEIYLYSQFDYIDLSWGNFQRNILLDGNYEGSVNMQVTQ